MAFKAEEIREDFFDIARHTIGLVLTLLSIWIIHLTLKFLLGENANFFGFIPIKYVIDVGDFIAFLKFIWHLIEDFRG